MEIVFKIQNTLNNYFEMQTTKYFYVFRWNIVQNTNCISNIGSKISSVRFRKDGSSCCE